MHAAFDNVAGGGGDPPDRHRVDANLSFDELFRTHYSRVYLYVRLRVSDHDAAQDISQDTFFSVWRRGELVEGGLGLLLRAAQARVADHYRKKALPTPIGGSADMDALGQDDLVENDGGIDRKIDSMVVNEALQHLALRHRQAAILHYFGEQTYPEIAAQLGISASRVELYVKQATRYLTTLLNGHAQPVRVPKPEPQAKVRTALEEAMAMLPSRRREVLERQVYRGLKPGMIAQELGITANCARVTLSKALTEVAQRLNVDKPTVLDMIKQFHSVRQGKSKVVTVSGDLPIRGGPNKSHADPQVGAASDRRAS